MYIFHTHTNTILYTHILYMCLRLKTGGIEIHWFPAKNSRFWGPYSALLSCLKIVSHGLAISSCTFWHFSDLQCLGMFDFTLKFGFRKSEVHHFCDSVFPHHTVNSWNHDLGLSIVVSPLQKVSFLQSPLGVAMIFGIRYRPRCAGQLVELASDAELGVPW